MTFKKLPFALTCGIFWGATVFIATAWILLFGGQGLILSRLEVFYVGYSVSWAGALIGLVWGFIDGFVCGFLFSWIYNALAGKKKTETQG